MVGTWWFPFFSALTTRRSAAKDPIVCVQVVRYQLVPPSPRGRACRPYLNSMKTDLSNRIPTEGVEPGSETLFSSLFRARATAWLSQTRFRGYPAA
ncbi:hypothetical protein GCM10017579_24230 [Nocardioides luteus]|uniref:Secreted protein n=1 Tax=Nocardioides luteus TaxID=1844 RepID=A0ABQ5SY40_9ACTN|nr:hypothetical protein GCM10017579_24230 [Nocardioides luteus]